MRGRVGSLIVAVIVIGPSRTLADATIDPGAPVVERTFGLVLIFDQNVRADRRLLFEISTAVEVRSVVGAARAIVDGRLRIRTERPGAGGNRAAPRQDLIRRHAVLDPVRERVEQILRLRSSAARAVRNARTAEQSVELLHVPEVDVLLTGGVAPTAVIARRHLTIIVEYATGQRHRSARSEELTSELQTHHDLVCRLLLEKKKENN